MAYIRVNEIITYAGNILLLLIYTSNVAAQTTPTSYPTVSVNVSDMPFRDFLSVLEQQTLYKFAYSTELIAKQKKVTLHVQNKPLDELFYSALKETNITYSFIGNQIVLNETLPPQKITLSGYIRDSLTGESLAGAIIYLPKTKTGTYTNDYGFYSISQDQTDSLELMISYLGFSKLYHKVRASRNIFQDFYLSADKVQLSPVVVSDNALDDNVKKHAIGMTDISIDRVKAVPSVNGNGDIVNTIQMMPGVIAGLDGRPGYFIRGGNIDQNLVQLDEATLYNPNHLLGLVGIFNSSAIKSAYLLKAGFPASFGDHLSSILDVTMKEGNDKQYGGDVQAGTVSGGVTLSGPLVRDKASFFLSARRSTIDLALKPMDFSNYYSNYYFYDINAKVNFRLTQKDRIYLSIYQGRDNSAYSKDSTLNNAIAYHVNYGNQASTLRWNHLFSQKLFLNTSLVYNSYHHQVNARQEHFYAELYSGIRDMQAKLDLNYYPTINHKITAGIDYNYQTLLPATISKQSVDPDNDLFIDPSGIERKYSSRIAVYFSDEVQLGRKFSAYIGGRMPIFYAKDVRYLQFEPRISLLHLINPTTSVKLSYTQMHQYLHQVQSYNSSFPAEVWISSNSLVKPEQSEEVSLGLFKNFKESTFRTSVEVYYKHMANQLLFRGGTTPEIRSNMDSTLIFGQGKSYGAEFLIEKPSGRFTGWLAYTLSYAYQKFDSLNFGHQFPFANDRRHSLYISASYDVNKHLRVSSNFVFSSGRAFSLFGNTGSWSSSNPLYYYGDLKKKFGVFTSGSNSATKSTGTKVEWEPGEDWNMPSSQIVQNNYRLAPYHRLDISISYHRTRNLGSRLLESEWVFSVYNVYARHNTFFAYCSIDPSTKQPIPVQVSFVPIIPSISYNLKF